MKYMHMVISSDQVRRDEFFVLMENHWVIGL